MYVCGRYFIKLHKSLPSRNNLSVNKMLNSCAEYIKVCIKVIFPKDKFARKTYDVSSFILRYFVGFRYQLPNDVGGVADSTHLPYLHVIQYHISDTDTGSFYYYPSVLVITDCRGSVIFLFLCLPGTGC